MAVDKLVDSTQLDGYFSDIADAIRGKNGSSDTYTPAQMPQAITDIPSGGGGGSVEEKDVNFIDYDGTLIESYDATDFANISSLPANPSHSGLIAQGWNWTLTDAKAYVAKYGRLQIGQSYTPSDGKTHVFITLHDTALSPVLGMCIDGSVTIDWGDNSSDTVTGTSVDVLINTTHTYATAGDYEITLDITGEIVIRNTTKNNMSTFIWKNDSVLLNNLEYTSAITKIFIGPDVTLGYRAFSNCYNLKYISLPFGLTDINQYVFYDCYSLNSVTFPKDSEAVTNLYYGFYYCFSLETVSFPSGMFTETSTYTFNSCFSLKAVTYPEVLTSIGQYAHSSCYSLKHLVLPDSLTNLGNSAFQNCYSLEDINIDTIDDVYINTSAFSYCRGAKHAKINHAYSLGNSAFSYCTTMEEIELPDDLEVINGAAFRACQCLRKITFPASLTNFQGGNEVADCFSLQEIHFKSTTPPSVAATTTFNNLPKSCKIYVPTGSLAAYTSATNYPSASTYTYIEE